MNNRRQNVRTRTARPARIVYDYRSVVACTICDLSPDGAGLEVSIFVPVPDTFDLITERDDDARTCRVIWRTTNRMGVWFR